MDKLSESGKLAVIAVPNSNYLAPLWKGALAAHGIGTTRDYTGNNTITGTKTFHYAEYDELDFDRIGSRDETYLACSYVYRKALIRKHYLTNTVQHYVAKNPDSILKRAYPDSYNLEVDYAEFLDDSLDEAFELRNEVDQNDYMWILKPSMSDRAQGIRLFSTLNQLQTIFDDFEEDGIETDDEGETDDGKRGIVTSQMRHFVAQRYVTNPLLLSAYSNRKFHIRVYVLAVGAMKVYVYRDMLALFAQYSYQTPQWEKDRIPLDSHLTNTCAQGGPTETLVERLSNLKGVSEVQHQQIVDAICECTGELFKAAVTVDRINFQSVENAFELYGLDYLVADDYTVRLLEVNAYPDFKQTGDDLKVLVQGLIESTVDTVVAPFYGKPAKQSEKLIPVLDYNVYNK